MAYEELVARLDESPRTLEVAAFPDGSVDIHCRVRDGDHELSTRESFKRALDAPRSALQLADRRREPGGQTVNMARQADALGDDVHLAGQLEDPIFEGLPFETTSMGVPAEVTVLAFEDEDLMLAARSESEGWTFRELAEVVDPERFLSVDLICWGNARMHRDLGETVRGILEGTAATTAGSTPGAAPVLVFDPGEVGGRSDESRRALLDAFRNLDDGIRAVISVNRPEVEALAAALPGEDDTLEGKLRRLRSRAGIDGVVAHTEETAVVATPTRTVSVPTLEIDRVVTLTGAGDRFTAGLGHGLAAGWGWKAALQLGNACGSHYVAHGESATGAVLRKRLPGWETR